MWFNWKEAIDSFLKQVNVTIRLLRDPRVARWKKAIPFLPVLYIISPLNLFSFSIPVLGQIDDFMLVMIAMQFMERLVDKKIVAEHRANVAVKRGETDVSP